MRMNTIITRFQQPLNLPKNVVKLSGIITIGTIKIAKPTDLCFLSQKFFTFSKLMEK